MQVSYLCNNHNNHFLFFYSLVSWWHSFAGVSNWGGYAIACALYILSTCEVHDRYLRKAVGFPQLSKKTVWLSALPSVTKVISVGPGSCDLPVTCRWNWLQLLNAAQSSSIAYFHMVFWWLLGIPGEQAAMLYLKYSANDTRQIGHKSPQKWMYSYAAASSTRQCYNFMSSAGNPCIAIQWLKLPVHFLSIIHDFINLCCILL